ncbi:MAG: hypothetical protein ACJARK_001580 [Marinobacter psychrophilus]|jgi:hypothetical protein
MSVLRFIANNRLLRTPEISMSRKQIDAASRPAYPRAVARNVFAS